MDPPFVLQLAANFWGRKIQKTIGRWLKPEINQLELVQTLVHEENTAFRKGYLLEGCMAKNELLLPYVQSIYSYIIDVYIYIYVSPSTAVPSSPRLSDERLIWSRKRPRSLRRSLWADKNLTWNPGSKPFQVEQKKISPLLVLVNQHSTTWFCDLYLINKQSFKKP